MDSTSVNDARKEPPHVRLQFRMSSGSETSVSLASTVSSLQCRPFLSESDLAFLSSAG